MKKYVLSILAITLALVACNKDETTTIPEEEQFVINFSIDNYDSAETKAVKDSWETGDVVFIFFYGVDSYLKLEYNGSGWTATPKGGLTANDLAKKSTKQLRAVYLPFGRDKIHWNSGSNWTYYQYFYDEASYVSEITRHYSYYLISEKVTYTIDSSEGLSTLSIESDTLPMSIPSGFVQFYIEDANAEDCMASLRVEHMVPAFLNYINSSLGVTGGALTGGSMEAMYGTAIPGYVYEKGGKKGYVFSGILSETARTNPVDYTFWLLKGNKGYRASVPNKQIAGKAVNISNLSWSEITVELVDLGLPSGTKWANMNLGALSETDLGNEFAWGDVNGYTYAGGIHSGYKRFYHTHMFSTYNYKFSASKYLQTYSKYVPTDKPDTWGGEGAPDNKLVLEPVDDAAYAVNASWRIPTKEQWEELLNTDYCTWTKEGDGFRVTSKMDGYTMNSIFLPRAERGLSNYMTRAYEWWQACYWSSSLNPASPTYAFCVDSSTSGMIDPTSVSVSVDGRSIGRNIRPVQN